MIKKLWKYIKSFFHKEGNYPNEFVVIKFTEQGKRNAIYSDESKEIVYFKFNETTERHDEYRVFNYSESIITAFKSKGMPVLDTTLEVGKMNILKKIRPEIMTFEVEY